MSPAVAWLLACLLASLAWPAQAQTRAWLDRAQVNHGETATLNIQTDQSVSSIDYAPLQRQFDVGGQTVRRSYQRSNGRSTAMSLFVVGLRPRGPGVFTVPALRVGNVTTAPLQLTVVAPSVLPASGDADAFVETVVDAARPYVQQAVGVQVRLHYAVPLMSGQLEQDPPAGASLRQVGEDLTYQREIDGRRYNVVERRFLLIPERSGALTLPGARFNGQTMGGFFDQVFDDGRKAVSAASPAKRLDVQPIPANAPQPWLPLHDLRLRYVQAPTQARAGEAASVEIEVIADGATATQLPPVALVDTPGVQLFADRPQVDEQFVDGRPRSILRRRIAIVPSQAGAVSIAGPRIEWWDAAQGVARTAMLPPLQLQVAAGANLIADPADAGKQVIANAGVDASKSSEFAWSRWWPWLLLGVLSLAGFAWWRWPRAKTTARNADDEASSPDAAASPIPSLQNALKHGELGVIAQALGVVAGMDRDDLDMVRQRLDDAAQIDAVMQLQAARWGDGDATSALAALRVAFAKGARWRKAAPASTSLLPPLYPER
ncbi:BatD family protein [Thermomonas carbonis]|uniref:BatD family protein n=1 Tax=Thermomonas carbonis TaxID=1463158 RepID=A0A7G9SRI3_9GAMM|nr:BatD family protein [Thermomonas carbonis]QNN70458.1 BatD family protein [Thermomonas carbonis]GHC00149.1 membrane protein [Thermomonas carbonis]